MATLAVVPQPPTLSESDRAAVVSLVSGVLSEEKSARRAEVREAWRQRAFKNGVQHMWYDPQSYAWMLPSASGQELPSFMDVYNIYTPHWRSFVSILSQNPPGVNFTPNDLTQSRDVTAANYAEKMRHRVDRLVHMKDRQAETSSYFCTDGRTIHRTYTNDKNKLNVTVHGVLESKVPIYVRRMDRWSYCVLSEEIDIWEAKEEYQEFAEEIESSDTTSAEASYERLARLGVIASKRGSFGDALKNVVTQHVAWLRPSRYRKASTATEQVLRQMYPQGFRATVINDVLLDIVPEVMEDALSVQWPSPGQGQSRPSMLSDLVAIQMAFNDALNMLREHVEFSIPATWASEDAVDIEAINSQRSAPGMIHPITVPKDASITDLVFQEQVAQLPPELVGNIDRLLQLAQFTTGDLPSLFGEGTPDQETATGQKMLSDQAKGQLSPAWGGMQWIFAGTYSLAVKKAATLDSDKPIIAIQGSKGSSKFSPQDILNGNWGCFPDTDSSFPETMADKRAALQLVLTQLGEAAAPLLAQPDNLKLIKQYGGINDLIIPGAEARDKALREIEQLLQETPVPDQTQMQQWQAQAQQAEATGQAVPPEPETCSIQIDPDWDFHQPIIDKVQEYLNSDSAFEETQKGNIRGLQNVKLYGMAHKKALAAQQQPAMGKPPNISITAQVTDPRTIAQILQLDGIQADPENLAESMVPDLQQKAAQTQHSAAQAQHASVLAAKEAVEPVTTSFNPQPPPEPAVKEK